MRIVRPTTFGGPEVLQVLDEDAPSPGVGEVLVGVRAIDVNPVDWKLYSGAFGADPGLLGAVGTSVSGVVLALGEPGADGPSLAVGDAVVARAVHGTTYAERVVADAAAVHALPAGVGFEEGAALLVAGGTAFHALDAVGLGDGEHAGQTLLVHGAAGGVGSMVVQLAVLRGVRVIATASERNHDYLRGLGAEPVTYGDGLADRVRALAPSGVDAVLDLVGTDEAVRTSLELVADRDRVATIVPGAAARGAGVRALGGGPGSDPGTAVRQASIPVLLRLVADRRLRVAVTVTYPLDRTSDAHRAGRDGHTRGKVVVVP
ncbi:NADP-dependent oxidoreductase [Luteimicrobium sp. DT211]|uniref:NADP-dependent oxidoreductase n=1 Tax=Luteimicrobium sp. DT211 TaxID=3393412 RepID=UPI003CEB1739